MWREDEILYCKFIYSVSNILYALSLHLHFLWEHGNSKLFINYLLKSLVSSVLTNIFFLTNIRASDPGIS